MLSNLFIFKWLW